MLQDQYQGFKLKYERSTHLGKGEKYYAFILVPRLNQSTSAHANPTLCSSSTPVCFRGVKCSKSFGKNSLAVFLKYMLLIWSGVEVQVRKCLCGLNCRRKSFVWSKNEGNCRNLHNLNGFQWFYCEGCGRKWILVKKLKLKIGLFNSM